jgi:2-polyprenyl-3-methyl-5-hydroxy-6-metoxy-1,4-benzoquinol methylase
MTTVEEGAFVAKEYWEKRLSEKWSLHGVGHICYGQPFNEWAYRVRKRVFLRQVRALPVNFPEARVLDVGSGTGFWLQVWKALGVRSLAGLDLTQVAVAKLREKFPDVEMSQQDIADPRALVKFQLQFDVISAIDVLYHITSDREYEQAIRNIAAMLKPNGYFVFSENLIRSRPRREEHWVGRTREDILRALSCEGLQNRRKVPRFVCMNSPSRASSSFLWRAAMAPVRVLPALGHVYGAALYPLELVLTRVIQEGPSVELVICQKAAV